MVDFIFFTVQDFQSSLLKALYTFQSKFQEAFKLICGRIPFFKKITQQQQHPLKEFQKFSIFNFAIDHVSWSVVLKSHFWKIQFFSTCDSGILWYQPHSTASGSWHIIRTLMLYICNPGFLVLVIIIIHAQCRDVCFSM